jgi:hypothetical protein
MVYVCIWITVVFALIITPVTIPLSLVAYLILCKFSSYYRELISIDENRSAFEIWKIEVSAVIRYWFKIFKAPWRFFEISGSFIEEEFTRNLELKMGEL